MKPSQFLHKLQANPLLGILRDPPKSSLALMPDLCAKTGLDFLEVTMNSRNALEMLHGLRLLLPESSPPFLGAGTVRTIRDLELALAAGAHFIVSPVFSAQVVGRCRELGIPCLPGALTPGEIQQAWEAGATMVKVFPAQSLGGPAYIKELRGPFRDIALLACGGVNIENAAKYRQAGADAVAFGSSIFSQKRLVEGNVEAMADDIRRLREALLSYK